jgi:hypothetical protein
VLLRTTGALSAEELEQIYDAFAELARVIGADPLGLTRTVWPLGHGTMPATTVAATRLTGSRH